MKIGLATRGGLGRLEELSRMGYRGVEIGSGTFEKLSPKELKQRLDGSGMAAAAFLCQKETLRDQIDRIAEQCLEVGCRYVVQVWGPVTSQAQVEEDGKEMAAFGARCRELGVRFCYHNHDKELMRFFGRVSAAEIWFEQIAPEDFGLEADLGWVRYGGWDVPGFLRKFGNRCPVTHLRDVADLSERGRWALIGEGCLDVKGTADAGVANGVEWFILEQGEIGGVSAEEGQARCAAYFRWLGML